MIDSDHHEQPESRGYQLWPLFLAMFLLMFVTFSPPQDYNSASSGIKSIMSPSRLTQLKVLARMTSAVVLLGGIFAISYRRNVVGMLVRFMPLILFVCWALASVTWSAEPKTTFVQAGSFGVLTVLCIAVSLFWSSETDTSRILQVVNWTLCLISLMLVMFRLGAPQYGALTRSSEGIFHATQAGSAASVGLLVCLLSRLIWNWKWTHFWLWIALPLHATVLLLAGNRLTLGLTTLLSCLAVLIFCRRERVAIAVFACGLIGTGYLLVDPGASTVEKGLTKLGMFVSQGQTQRQLQSISGRTEMWDQIFRSIEKSPWKGHGYFVSSESGQLYVWYQWGNWTAHNLWLQVLVTTGLIGLTIFAGHLLVVGHAAIRLARSSQQVAHRHLGFLLIFLLWYLGWGLLNSSIFGPTSPEAVFFFVFTGIAIAASARTWEHAP